ncbi:MAG: fasciclin domain-containing protein [Flavobacteriaceae bacterium]|nr:fasciclin domain-containing protein [Flavobacteriaceae bacterium]
MNYTKQIKRISLALVLLISLTSCSNDDDNTATVQEQTITEIAIGNESFSTLVAALQIAGLAETLNGEGPFTVFAPTDAAFNAFLTANGFNQLSDVPTDVLTQILLNHVISGELMSGDLSTSYGNTLATTASGENLSIYINTSNGVRLNNVSSVSQADINASNGVIHIVDAVIGLPTVVDFALADPTFETLVAALTRNDLTFDYVTTLSTPNGTSPAPFTVFAPTNDAFGDLLNELGASGLSDISEPVLKATLDHHAIAGANVQSSSLTDNMIVETLGGNITINVTGGATITDANNRISNIIAVDVQALNGVIHAIDKVILPPL